MIYINTTTSKHDHNNVLYKRYKAMHCTIVDRLDVNIAHGALKGFYASQNQISLLHKPFVGAAPGDL